ncbi:MAG: PepSY domain-containing protein [Ideonella sp.]|nr:PepSY domain-containing protein [Ideonella sp.]
MALACRTSRNRLAPLALGMLVAWLLVVPVEAEARDNRDHDRARAAMQAGEVLPLGTLLERVQRRHPGQVLEVELEREDGRWIYELKLLQPGGQLLKLEVDAANGQVLDVRRRKAERPPASP